MSLSSKKYRTTVKCKYCGAAGLQWAATAAGYRLYDTKPNGDGTVSIVETSQHSCLSTGASAAVAAEPVRREVVEVDAETAAMVAAAAPKASVTGAIEPTKAKKAKTLGTRAAWHQVLGALWAAGSRRILIAGPPGTGKTTTALQTLGTQYRVTMTEGTGVEDLLGCFQLRKVKDEDSTPQTVWVDGVAVRAMREGKGLLIDEGDKMPPEIQSLAYALMDDKPEIMLPTGEMVKAAAGYGVIMTTNANLAVLPEAIIDRVESGLVAVTPHPDAISHMPDAERNAVMNYFRSVSPDQWKWAGNPTVRRMRSFVALVAAGTMSDELVAECVFGKAGKEILSALTTAGRKTDNAATPDLL